MRVKVRKTPGVTGAQKNFALISGSIWNYEDQPTNNTVGTTLSPVPREDANIEAEKGETIVFPDIDGNIAHAKIGGKRHSEGGTPLNVPDGSFVFSDYRGLLIKNKDVLKDVFNIGGGKSKTPAEVAKKYELNVYKQILADPWADPMDKKTAQLMIENNMKKLGQLALIQEGMKGFPDGIPDIALPLFGSDIAQGQPIPQEQGMPMARYGGLPKAQSGKTTKVNNPQLDPNMRMMLLKAKEKWNSTKTGSAEEKQAKQYLLNFLNANPEYAKLPSMTEFLSQANLEGYGDIAEMKKTVDKANAQKIGKAQKTFGQNRISSLGMYESAAAKAAGYKEANTVKDKKIAKEITDLPVSEIYASGLGSKDSREEFMNRMAADYLSQYPDSEFPTTLPSDDPIKAAQVAEANRIYRDAVVNAEAWQDPQVMLDANEILKSDAYDISGWSTPLGMIGEGARYFNQGLKNFVQNPFFINTMLGTQWTPSNFESYNPWGKTWQEKVTDMGDVLENRAEKMKSQLQNEKTNKQIRKKGTEGIDKLNKSVAKAQEIIANPSLYTPEQLSTASDLLYNVNNDISQTWYKPTRWMGYDPEYLMQKDVERPLDMSSLNSNKGILSTAAGDPYTYVDQVYNTLIGPAAKDAPDQMETSSSSSSADNPYPEGNYFNSKTGEYLNGATDATTVVLKEQTKVNQVDKKLRDNGNAPYEEKIGNKYVQYIRRPDGKIAALFIPKLTTDVVEEETTSDSTTTGEVKTKEVKTGEKKEEASDDYTTLEESNSLWEQAVPASEKKKLGGEQKIISYDPTRKFEMGGQLSQYKGGGGKHTQLIKETAIKSTDAYDVVMPNKKLDYTFGTQGFDSSKNYYTAINKTTGKQEELDLNDFINRQTDVLKGYDGGIDKWKTDVLSTDKATREKAAGWFQENYNTWRKANGLPEYFITKSGSNPYGKDKKLGVYTWSAPGIKKKVKADVIPPPPGDTPPPPPPTPPTKPGEVPPQNYESGIAGTPWWHYDLVNYGNQLGNYFDIEPGALPTFMNYVPYIPDPTFLDPARAIAQQQGVVRGTQEAIMAASDPTVARANMIAASAAAAPQIANIMAQYDERNAGIANQYESSGAQMLNQAQLQNQQFEKQYRDELEVRRQQYQNALREGKTNVAKSIMQGLKNAAETSWVNATSDSYAVDPGTGQVYFKRGFDPLKGSFRSQTGSIADAYEELLNKGWSDEQARSILELQVKSKLPMNKSEAKMGGMLYNPMDLIWND